MKSKILAFLVLAAGLTLATITRAQTLEAGSPPPVADPKIEKELEDTTLRIERYRAEIEALVHGVPGFKERQEALDLPGDPVNETVLPTSRPGHPASGRNQSTLMVFLTLSMPDEALAGWLDQTARAGGVAVIRGLHEDRLSTTLDRITRLQERAPVTRTRGGVSIDPSAFNRFGVAVAPTVIVLSGVLPPCTSRGCSDDPAPAHDRIAGNITLKHALRLLAADGDAAPLLARQHLNILEKGD